MNRKQFKETLCQRNPKYRDYYDEILDTFSSLELETSIPEDTIQTILEEAKHEYETFERKR